MEQSDFLPKEFAAFTPSRPPFPPAASGGQATWRSD